MAFTTFDKTKYFISFLMYHLFISYYFLIPKFKIQNSAATEAAFSILNFASYSICLFI